MPTGVTMVFTGAAASSTGAVVGANGVKAGDRILVVVELSPQFGTDRTNLFGMASPEDGVILQLPGTTDLSAHTFIVSLSRP